jgi:hypothetical protein
MPYQDYLNKLLNENKKSGGMKEYILDYLDGLWDDMRSEHGPRKRWFSNNAPKKLVEKARQIVVTDEVISKLEKMYNKFPGTQSIDVKKFMTDVDDGTLVDKFYPHIMSLNSKVYKYVNTHGDDKEWQGKWGNDF